MPSSAASLSSENSCRWGSRYPCVRKNSTSSSVSMVASLSFTGRRTTTVVPKRRSRRDGLRAQSTYLPALANRASGTRALHRPDDLDEQLHVLDVVLGGGLDDAVP